MMITSFKPPGGSLIPFLAAAAALLVALTDLGSVDIDHDDDSVSLMQVGRGSQTDPAHGAGIDASSASAPALVLLRPPRPPLPEAPGQAAAKVREALAGACAAALVAVCVCLVLSASCALASRGAPLLEAFTRSAPLSGGAATAKLHGDQEPYFQFRREIARLQSAVGVVERQELAAPLAGGGPFDRSIASVMRRAAAANAVLQYSAPLHMLQGAAQDGGTGGTFSPDAHVSFDLTCQHAGASLGVCVGPVHAAAQLSSEPLRMLTVSADLTSRVPSAVAVPLLEHGSVVSWKVCKVDGSFYGELRAHPAGSHTVVRDGTPVLFIDSVGEREDLALQVRAGDGCVLAEADSGGGSEQVGIRVSCGAEPAAVVTVILAVLLLSTTAKTA